MPSGINELVRRSQQEEIILKDLLGFTELLLCLLKVKVDVQRLDEIGDGIAVLVALLPDDPDQILELLLVLVRVAALIPVCDDSGSEVAQDPWAVCLDGVDVGGGEEHVGEGLAGGLMVKEREQRPVDQPCAVLELCEGVVEEAGVNNFLELVDLFDGRVPVYGKDLASKLAPGGFAFLVTICGLLCC